MATAKADYAPYAAQEPEGVPAFAAVGGEIKATVTGSAHDTQGRLRKNSPQVIGVLQRLQRKIEAHAEEMALVRPDLDPEARVPADQLRCNSTRCPPSGQQAAHRGLANFLPANSIPVPHSPEMVGSGGRRRGSGFCGRGKLDRSISRCPYALSFRQADLRHQPDRQSDFSERNRPRGAGGDGMTPEALIPLPHRQTPVLPGLWALAGGAPTEPRAGAIGVAAAIGCA